MTPDKIVSDVVKCPKCGKPMTPAYRRVDVAQWKGYYCYDCNEEKTACPACNGEHTGWDCPNAHGGWE